MLEQIPWPELEIVAADGSPEVECGRLLPLVLHGRSGRYFRLGRGDFEHASTDTFLSREDVEALYAAGAATPLTPPCPAFPQAVVLFHTREFRGAIRPYQVAALHPRREWRSDREDTRFVALTDFEACAFLDACAEELRMEASRLLEDHLERPNGGCSERAERVVDLGLCAAVAPDLRRSLYVQFGAALQFQRNADGLHNVHSLIIRPEFPDWPLEQFLQDIWEATLLLKYQVQMSRVSQTTVSILEFIRDSCVQIRSLADREEQLRAAERRAAEAASFLPLNARVAEGLAMRVNRARSGESGFVHLERDELAVLSHEPAVHYGNVVFASPGGAGPMLDVVDLDKSLRDVSEHSLAPGPFSRLLRSERSLVESGGRR